MIRVEQVGPVTAIRMARSFLGRPVHWTAAYWIDGLLIDCGPACTARELARVLEPVPVEQVVITHSHEDHIGGLTAIHQRFPQARIYAAHRSLPAIEQPAKLQMQIYRRLIWGRPQPFYKARPLPDVIHTRDHTFRVIETPGHSVDHVAFFEGQRRWVFCGDLFVGGQERSWSPEFNLFGIVGSLQTLVALTPSILFPGCGAIRKEPGAEILGKIRYLTQLCAHVHQLEIQGAPLEEMVDKVLGGESRMKFWTAGHDSAANLIKACRNYNAILGHPMSAGPPHPSNPSWSEEDLPPSESEDLEDFSDLGDLSDFIR